MTPPGPVAVFKEAAFPSDYREAEVRRILLAVYRRRSIAVHGLAGMGKSNLVRFILSHPDVRQHHLGERAATCAFVYVDGTAVAGGDEDAVLDEVAAQLWRLGLTTQDAGLPASLRTPRRNLREQILSQNPDLDLVLVFDYFDEAAHTLESPFYNYLFHLRNARPRGNLTYILVTRRPTHPLGELQELFDEPCYVGPLGRADALASLQRDEARLGCTLGPEIRERVVAAAGGHPGLLKNATEVVASHGSPEEMCMARIVQQCLQADRVRNLCNELWGDLTEGEQATLLRMATGTVTGAWGAAKDRRQVAELERFGLLTRAGGPQDDLALSLFSPLFESYVRECTRRSATGARIETVLPNQARITGLMGEQDIALSPRLFALLLALTQGQGQIVTTDALIDSVFGAEAEGVSNAALAQLVKRLRAALNPALRRMANDSEADCVETIRDVGYRLYG